jgi:transposase InsO family protein
VSDERIKHQDQIVLKAHNLPAELHNLHAQAVTSLPEQEKEPLDEEEDQDILDVDKMMTEAYETDPAILDLVRAIRSKARLFRREGWKISLASCELQDGRVYHNSRLVVPANEDLRLELLRLHHDAPIAGHPGRSNTYKLLARSYFWPLMGSDVARYVRNCALCRRTKNLRQSTPGLLQSMPVPSQRWQEISVDFVTGIPQSGNNYNAVMCVVDRLTKRRRLIPCRDDIDARGTAELYIQHVYSQHGLSEFVTSDRGPQFTAAFWKQVCRRLGIRQRLSTAYHPETDGQTENANAVFEQYLRAYVNYLQDDWSDWLSLAEFTANNWTSESTQFSPFYADIGRHPRTGYKPKTANSVNPRL